MYCKNCGKEIESGVLCTDCLINENGALYEEPVVMNDSVMLGFGKALTATILGFVGYIFAIVLYIFSLTSFIIGEAGVIALLQLVLSAPFAIISLINGISSIKLFKSTHGKKPIPAFILGINAVAFAGLTFLFIFISLIFGALA